MLNFSRTAQPNKTEEEDSSVLLSIGDLMAGLLMIFALLFVTVLVQLKEREKPVRVLIGQITQQLKANRIEVKVNEKTGDISIRDDILFDENSAVLKSDGKKFLDEFIPVYSKTIFSRPEFDEEITRVIIEGHTSSKGTYLDNLDLSLRRALSVARYVASDDLQFGTKEDLLQKIMASGRGEIEARQDIDDPEDRRVQFRFQFKGQQFSEWYRENRSLLDD